MAVPPGASGASWSAVRYDAVRIIRGRGTAQPGEATLGARFVASEFMGSKVIYFFKKEDGGVFEVERHLSSSDPETFPEGEPVSLVWRLSDALFFDARGDLIETAQAKGAA
jgi:hypothetical protein